MLHLKTLSTYLIKEALAMLILWLHGTIAYTLHAYTVQKARSCGCVHRTQHPLPYVRPSVHRSSHHHTHHTNTQIPTKQISPARLARTLRVWLQALLAFGYMCLHAILSLTVRDRLVGYYIGRMSYDGEFKAEKCECVVGGNGTGRATVEVWVGSVGGLCDV